MARTVGAIAETVAFRVVLMADTFAAEGRSLFCLLTTSENHPFISFFQGKTWIDILVFDHLSFGQVVGWLVFLSRNLSFRRGGSFR